MGKILRLDMAKREIRYEEVPEDLRNLGGRALSSTVVAQEVRPTCDALGPENKLVFAPGILTGTSCPNSGRFSVGGKSPLTGGIKESNAGGECPAKLARIGLSAIVVEGKPEAGTLFLLILRKDSAELIEAIEFKGTGTYAFTESMKKRYGEHVGVIVIGPAGEMMLRSASIQVSDVDGRPCRAAARGGLGALMGSKGIKAIVVDDRDGESPPIANPQMFKSGQKKLAQAIVNHPATGQAMPALGTTMILGPVNAAGAFPAINAKVGFYEKWEEISGEKLADVINERGGKTGHMGCTNCIIRCSNVFVDKNKKYVTSSLEYETIYALGAMCDIADLDTIAKLDWLCDDMGVDTVNTGVAVAVAMEAGIKPFGDKKGALELVQEIRTGSELGKLIGNGPVAIGEKYGVKRIPAVRHQAIPAYDPRGIQGIGVTYACSNMGADHNDAWVIGANLEAMGGQLNPLSPEGQVDCFKETQLQTAAADSTGLCNFVNFPVADDPSGGEGFLELLNGKNGTNWGPENIAELGRRIVLTEREFNVAAGWVKSDNRLPEFYYKEPLPPHNKTFLVPDEELDSVYGV